MPLIDEITGEEYYVPTPLEPRKKSGFEPRPIIPVGIDNVVAITGHRPEKLDNPTFIAAIIEQVFGLQEIGLVVSGMASGVDLMAAEIAIKMKIPVAAIRPWNYHAPRKGDKALYEYVMKHAAIKHDVVRVYPKEKGVEPDYPGDYVYPNRNKWMVDNSDKVFAIWDGSSGGTAHCVNYAFEKKRRVLRYDPLEAQFILYDEEGNEYKQA